jgi:hypothetical protein
MNPQFHPLRFALDVNDDPLDQLTKNHLAILVGRVGGVPKRREIFGKSLNLTDFIRGETLRLFSAVMIEVSL